MKARRWFALAVAVLATASAACSGDGDTAPADPDFAEMLAWDIEQARAAGATEEQVALLEEAARAGEVPFEVYNEAVERALRCMREAGVAVSDHGVRTHNGVQTRSYGVPVEAEAADSREPRPGITVHRCIAEHSYWIESVYQIQPSSLEAEEANFERFREAIVECLTEQGVTVEPELTRVEILMLNIEAFNEGRIGRDCAHESGYSQS